MDTVRLPRPSLRLTLACCLIWAARASAVELAYPADAGVIDARATYGAVGDGVVDDTAALERAIDAARSGSNTVYLRAGTYRVSRPLGNSALLVGIVGQDRDTTVIRLADRSSGYGDPLQPRWVLSTTNAIENLTIDTGAGNPGAIALRCVASSPRGVRNTVLRSADGAGAVGLDLRFPGGNSPCLFSGIRIRGFDYGVATRFWAYNCQWNFDHLTLVGQRVCGFLNQESSVAIRGLISINSVPALRNQTGNLETGLVTLLDASCTGGSATSAAVISDGPLSIRSLVTAGYGAALAIRGVSTAGPSIARYGTEPFRGTDRSSTTLPLDLPVQDTPPLPWEAPTAWRSPATLGQAAVADALVYADTHGISTVYLPKGNYVFVRPITLSGSLRTIHGLGSNLIAASTLTGSRIITLAGRTNRWIERCSFAPAAGGTTWIEHTGGDLVLSDCVGPTYHSAAGARRLFIEATTTLPANDAHPPIVLDAPRQPVFMRAIQLHGSQTKIVNNAADLWVLGMKTAGIGTSVRTGRYGRSALFGGFAYPAAEAGTVPAFQVDAGGSLTAVMSLLGCNENAVVDAGATLTYTTLRATSSRCLFYASSNIGALAPRITVQPQDRTVDTGATATFSVTATGTGPLLYQWQAAAPGGTVFTAIPGATSATYGVLGTTIAMSGTRFRCVVANAGPTVAVSTPATLTIQVPIIAPTITVQPQSRLLVQLGVRSVIAVQATGTPPLTYQWQCAPPGSGTFSDIPNGALGIPGDAPSNLLFTPIATMAMDGTRYRCVVSNGARTAVVSTTTVLTVVAFPVSINFQPLDTPPASGCVPDRGALFGDRGNLRSYGWNLDLSAQGRDRNAGASPDQRYDTFISMQQQAPEGVWELAVPDGSYEVHIVCGDALSYDSVYRIDAEGIRVVDGTPTSAARWVEGRAQVTVGDGRLTVRPGSGAVNAKLCSIEITALPAGSG